MSDQRRTPSYEELAELVVLQAKQIAELKAEVAELRRRLGMNSSNSSKPPSADGLDKPKRQRSGAAGDEGGPRRRGKQRGAPGVTRRMVDNPDETLEHRPSRCGNQACGASLADAAEYARQRRQVFDHRGIVRVSVLRGTGSEGYPVPVVDCWGVCVGQGREVEVKYLVADVEGLLVALKARGISLGEPVVQDDQAYAPVGWSYGDSKLGVSFVRLRTVDGRHTFTLKRPAENALSCDEFETSVADREQMHRAILAMGFYPTVRVVKVRRTATLGDVSVCVDEVEGLGSFLELERIVPPGVSGEAVQAELAAFVESLGVAAERTGETYDSLVRSALESR